MSFRWNAVLLPPVRAMGVGCVLLGAACAPLGFTRTPEPVAPPAIIFERPPIPVWEAPAAAPIARPSDGELQRLQRLAEVWHAVRWFHPWVLESPARWDSAYLRQVDEARLAPTDAAFAQAVQGMIRVLADDGSRVVVDTSSVAPAPYRAAATLTTPDGMVVARPVGLSTPVSTPGLVPLAPRTAAVLDLRSDSGRVGDATWRPRALVDAEFALPGGLLTHPVRRSVRRTGPDGVRGPVPTVLTAPRTCCAEYTLTTAAAVVPEGTSDTLLVRTLPEPPRRRAAPEGTPLVVVIDDRTVVPAPLLTLHAAGYVRFVSVGTGLVRSDAAAVHLPLGGGFFARLRREELLLGDGRAVVARADTVLTQEGLRGLGPDTTDAALALALAIARGTVRADGSAANALPSRLDAAPRFAPLPEVLPVYPSHPERLLAVTTLWGTVRAFNPYLPMSDETWDDAFTRALGDVAESANARAYATALFRFAATLDASQAEMRGPEHPEFGRRTGRLPLELRLAERRAMVVRIDDSTAARSGVRVGDEVLAIGGEPIDKRFGRLRELISASNAWAREQQLVDWLESGPSLYKVTLQVRGGSASDRPRDVEFMYSERAATARTGVVSTRRVDTLSGGVVYVALGAADTPLPASLASAPALIVDARGVTSDVAARWLSGSVLDADARAFAREDVVTLTAPPTAALRTPEVDPARQATRVERVTPRAPRERFTGPMAILVDAGTRGDGELLVLRLLADGGPRVLVGTPTAGAVGEVITIVLSGGVQLTFPITDIRHPDGRFVQRLGLTPSVNAPVTVSGVRSGRDEAVEAAQRWITQQLAPPPPIRRR